MRPVDESCITLEPDYKRISDASQLDDDGVIALCKEIILLLRDDYIRSIHYMETHHIIDSPRYIAAEKRKKEIEQFTHTSFFHAMFDMNGKRFLKMLLEEPAG